MKTFALLTFSLLSLSQIPLAQAWHEISDIPVKHIAELPDSEAETSLAAEVEKDSAQRRHWHRQGGYCYRPGYYGTDSNPASEVAATDSPADSVED